MRKLMAENDDQIFGKAIKIETERETVVMPELEALQLLEEFSKHLLEEVMNRHEEASDKCFDYAQLGESELLTEDERDEIVGKNRDVYGKTEAYNEVSEILLPAVEEFLRSREVDEE